MGPDWDVPGRDDSSSGDDGVRGGEDALIVMDGGETTLKTAVGAIRPLGKLAGDGEMFNADDGGERGELVCSALESREITVSVSGRCRRVHTKPRVSASCFLG